MALALAPSLLASSTAFCSTFTTSAAAASATTTAAPPAALSTPSLSVDSITPATSTTCTTCTTSIQPSTTAALSPDGFISKLRQGCPIIALPPSTSAGAVGC